MKNQNQTVPQLRRQCSKLGLPTSGKKAELLARLQSHQPITEATPCKDLETPESIQCLIATSIAGDLQDPFAMAQQSLQDAAEVDPLQEEHMHDGSIAITNERGTFWTRIGQDHASLRTEFRSVTDQLRCVTDELQSKTDQLYVKTDELERVTTGYRDFRNRFISTYKRDVLNQIEDSDRNFIRLGNVLVHAGNVKRDAELYTGLNARRDVLVFRKLYGILPAIASTIDYRPTILVLDKHATVVSNLQVTPTQAFHDCFGDFITALNERGYTGDYLEKNEAPTKEYWAFWETVKTDVIRTG